MSQRSPPARRGLRLPRQRERLSRQAPAHGSAGGAGGSRREAAAFQTHFQHHKVNE